MVGIHSYSTSSFALMMQFIFGAEKDNEDRVIDADRLKLLFEVTFCFSLSLSFFLSHTLSPKHLYKRNHTLYSNRDSIVMTELSM